MEDAYFKYVNVCIVSGQHVEEVDDLVIEGSKSSNGTIRRNFLKMVESH